MKTGYVVLLTVGLLGAITFVMLYAIGSPEWRHSSLGRNLMAKSVVVGGLLGLSLLSFLVHIPDWIWYAGMASLDVVLWWRVTILWRVQRGE